MEGADTTRVCAACGETVPAAFRFCGACGSPLGDPAAEESRRTVTVLFCDLVGSTTLAEGRDPEVVRGIIGRYFDLVATAVTDNGGAVEKFIGDAVMAVFGLPVIHEDDAVRAVRAALRARDGIDSLNLEFHSGHDLALQVRIGIHTGEVVAGDATSSQRMVTGDTVNVAARLEQSAPVHHIVIGDSTRALVKGAFHTEDLGEIVLRGRATPLRVHRVLGPQDAAASVVASEALVGRHDELARIEACWGTSLDARIPTAVCISAPPGTGKSRLVGEVVRRRRAEGATVVTVRAGVEAGPAALLREAFHGAGAPSAALASDALRLLAELDRGTEGGATTTDETVWAVARHITARAREAPILLVLEDAHWVGLPVLDLLRRLSDEDVPLLVAVTTRPEGASDVRPVLDAYREVSWTDLPGLAPVEAAMLIEELVDGDVDPVVVAHLVHQTEGNPLFLEQTVSFLVEEGLLQKSSGTWSARLAVAELPVAATAAAAVSARLDALDPRQRRVLELASVVGQSFALEAVTALGRAVGVDDVEPLAQLLVRRGFLVVDVDTETPAALRFWHALVQDAAYRRMLKRDRARLHELHAEWLVDADTAATDSLDREAAIGDHYLRAWLAWQELSPDGAQAEAVGGRAADHLLRAGRLALHRGEVQRGAGLLASAIQPMPRDDTRLPAALIDLGSAQHEMGDVDDALVVLVRALRMGEELGDVSVTWAAQWALADSPRRPTNPIYWDDREGIAAARRIMPELEAQGDRRGLAKAWRLLALCAFHEGDATTCVEASWEGGRQARLAGDEREYAEIMALVPWGLTEAPGRLTDALMACDEILHELRPNVRSWAFAASARAFLLGAMLRTEEARQQMADVVEALERIGVSRWHTDVALASAEIELAAGELERGIAILEALQARSDGPSSGEWVLCHSFLDLGRVEDARAVVEDDTLSDRDVAWDAQRHSARARLLAHDGRTGEARAAADRALRLVRRGGLERVALAVRLEVADAWWLIGRRAAAAAAAESVAQQCAVRDDLGGVQRARRFLNAHALG